MDLHRIVNRERIAVIVPLVVGVISAIILFGIQEPVHGPDGIVGYKDAIDPHFVIIYSVITYILTSALVHLLYWLIARCQVWCLQTG
jgi:F0F1-type ATP synthase assembly protein I